MQTIDGDQKDDFPLWEVHIKKVNTTCKQLNIDYTKFTIRL